MKLKDSTFAIIAEKKDSISHKWFKANLAKSQEMSYWNSGELYEYNKTLYICGKAEEDVYCEPIYTESEFEALLKAEQDSMKDELFLSIEANEKILKEAATLNKSQISGVIDWINTWEQLKDTAIPLRFEEDFMSKLKAEQENERFDQVLQKGIDNSRLNETKQITKVIKHRYSGKKSQKFWDIVNSIENEADRQELYSLGVMLQNSEEYVLRQLSNLNLCTVTKD